MPGTRGREPFPGQVQRHFAEKAKGKLHNGNIAIVANRDGYCLIFIDNAMKELRGGVYRTVAMH